MWFNHSFSHSAFPLFLIKSYFKYANGSFHSSKTFRWSYFLTRNRKKSGGNHLHDQAQMHGWFRLQCREVMHYIQKYKLILFCCLHQLMESLTSIRRWMLTERLKQPSRSSNSYDQPCPRQVTAWSLVKDYERHPCGSDLK